MKTSQLLSAPTINFVREKIKEFDGNNEPTERALALLIERFPTNTDLAHVLLKVVALNSLYSTQIRGVYAVAQRIVECAIDPRLDSGNADVVDSIATVHFNGKSRRNYSFATKYCSWHRPELYPIYDSRVDFCLRVYARQDSFAKFVQEDLRNYEVFHGLIKAFSNHYGLESLSFKELDKFLYQLGNHYFNSEKSLSNTTI